MQAWRQVTNDQLPCRPHSWPSDGRGRGCGDRTTRWCTSARVNLSVPNVCISSMRLYHLLLARGEREPFSALAKRHVVLSREEVVYTLDVRAPLEEPD